MTTEEIDKARECECLSKIQDLLNKQAGTEVELQLRACVVTDPHAKQWEAFTDLPPLSYKFREKKKVRTGIIKFSYCPFCGKKRQP